jgi:hypothetical protein
MGVYQIKNSINGKRFIGSSMNLPKAIVALEEKWLTNLQPYDENGYNKVKIIRK